MLVITILQVYTAIYSEKVWNLLLFFSPFYHPFVIYTENQERIMKKVFLAPYSVLKTISLFLGRVLRGSIGGYVRRYFPPFSWQYLAFYGILVLLLLAKCLINIFRCVRQERISIRGSVRASVRPSIRPSVRRSVGPSVTPVQKPRFSAYFLQR